MVEANEEGKRFGYQGDGFKRGLVKTGPQDKSWLVGKLARTSWARFPGKAFGRGSRGCAGMRSTWTGLLAPGSGRDGARTTLAWAERRPFLNAHGSPCASRKRAVPAGLRLRHLQRHPRPSPPSPAAFSH